MADDVLRAPTPERVSSRLETKWLGRAYEWHDACGSTNDLAGARAKAGAPEGLVVATERQSAGRGRLGRVWHSPGGENLYLSVLLRPTRPAPELPPLTLLAGAAVARALARLGFRPRLKWPNDVQLFANGAPGDAAPANTAPGNGAPKNGAPDEAAPRKVAGILTEMSSEGGRVGHVVVGLGLNVNGLAFPPELAARATSMRLIAGRGFERAAVLAGVLAELEPLYADFAARGPEAARAAFEPFASLGERCRVSASGADLEGTMLGLDADGALRLRDDAGDIHRVLSGEIAT
jgi:BirA family biotin operon repressor/biotin-[acetyl-CoA-carboxylase] ligase